MAFKRLEFSAPKKIVEYNYGLVIFDFPFKTQSKTVNYSSFECFSGRTSQYCFFHISRFKKIIKLHSIAYFDEVLTLMGRFVATIGGRRTMINARIATLFQ